MARLKEYYRKEVIPALMKEFNYKNTMQVPKIEKIVVNMGLGEATQNIKVLDNAAEELAVIVGQKPVITKARKSIATFKVLTGWSMLRFHALGISGEFHHDLLTDGEIFLLVSGSSLFFLKSNMIKSTK